MIQYAVATFYKFVNLPDYREIQPTLLIECKRLEIKGTILLADEGINATISGRPENVSEFHRYLTSIPHFADILFQITESDFVPFSKMKVRLKGEIVRLKASGLDPTDPGIYLNAHEWNELITEPNVFVVDTRNYYEISFGSFKNAINPETRCFSEVISWLHDKLATRPKDSKIAMYCTGGIRCEKSTAYVKSMGFSNVYHLKGGVLKYFEDMKDRIEENLWDGLLYLFDDRIGVDKQLRPARSTASI